MAEFYLSIRDPEAMAEAFEEDMMNFQEVLSQAVGVNGVEMVTESQVPDGAKGIGKAIIGFFELDIVVENAGDVITALKDMAQGREVEIMRKKPDGDEIQIKANVKDLGAVQDFLKGLDAE